MPAKMAAVWPEGAIGRANLSGKSARKFPFPAGLHIA
jgi:hypothetical protein